MKKIKFRNFGLTLAFTCFSLVMAFNFQQCAPAEFTLMSKKGPGGVGSQELPPCSNTVTTNCIDTHLSCGEHPHGSLWFESTQETTTRSIDCQYGPDVENKYYVVKEFRCQNGQKVPTGQSREGELANAGQCSQTPANCGDKLHNSKWWISVTGEKSVERLCPSTDLKVEDFYSFQQEYKCNDGTVSATGSERLIDLVRRGNCPGQKNCGSHTERAKWYIPVDKGIRKERRCPGGGQTVDLYNLSKEMTCEAGIEVETGRTKEGDLYSQGQCPGNNNCGVRSHNEVWLEETSEEISEAHTCANNMSTEALFRKMVRKKCVGGNISIVDGNVKGSLISLGKCPYRDCGLYAHNELWFLDNGKEEKVAKTCQFGPHQPPPFAIFALLQSYTCNDGKTIDQNETVRGPQKGEEGQCYACRPGSTVSCPVENGQGRKICLPNGSGFGSCEVENCNPKCHRRGNLCHPNLCEPGAKRPCQPSHPNTVFEETCNSEGSAWGQCNPIRCKNGFAMVAGQCSPVICQPGSKTNQGCSPVTNGVNQKTCNETGTSYGACVLSCSDGSTPINGMCPTFAWQPTNDWSQCSQDCGGQQLRIYVCKDSQGQIVDDSKCMSPKPTSTRSCDGRSDRWEGEAAYENRRGLCPGFAIGYVAQVFKKPALHYCSQGVKKTEYGPATLHSETPYCSAIQPARCNHDSLSPSQALGRLEWMKKCENQVPAIKTFFEIIGGPDQLSNYLNDTTSGEYGRPRPRPLYVTFSAGDGSPWMAPAPGSADWTLGAVLPPEFQQQIDSLSCNVPQGLKVFGVCTSSCYTPDQRLLFSSQAGQEYIAILTARDKKMSEIVTLSDDSTFEKLVLKAASVGQFISELVDSNHKVVTFDMSSGGRLTVTHGHPLVDGDGYVREAADFKVGEFLVKADGTPDKISKITQSIHKGKVYNVLPMSTSTLGHIVIAEGYLNGSAYYQNDGVKFMNQKILRKNLTEGIK